jgi:hypothetical protein
VILRAGLDHEDGDRNKSDAALKGEPEMDAYNAAILKAVTALAGVVAGKSGGCCPAVAVRR